MTDQTPCRDPQNDPDDWFIDKDGKQYPDDAYLSADESQALYSANENATADEMEAILDEAEEEAKKAALRKRRHAKDECHTTCYFRTHCLQAALDTQPEHGTWGGYYREELKVLYREIDARKRRKSGCELRLLDD